MVLKFQFIYFHLSFVKKRVLTNFVIFLSQLRKSSPSTPILTWNRFLARITSYHMRKSSLLNQILLRWASNISPLSAFSNNTYNLAHSPSNNKSYSR